MKKIFAFAFLVPMALAAQHEKACGKFADISRLVQERHIKPKPIDDSLSVYVFNTVMDELDNNHTLFLKSEHDLLAKHKSSIDNYLDNRDCDFFTDFISLYSNALLRYKGYIEDIAREHIGYNTKDTIYFSKNVFPYPAEKEKIKYYLRKRIIYDILEDVAKLSKNKDSLTANIDVLFAKSKSKIIESYICRADALINPPQGFDNSICNLFFSAFCSYFDPHSTYFNYDEKSSFISTIASENYSLGLYISQNEKEEVIVEDIVPGGPAYKTGKVDKGDQLIQLSVNNTEYIVSCAAMETINDIVFSDSYKNVTLTLRKKDGTVYSINLEKTIMKADDHTVYSFILGNENPIGYIKIPSFYTAMDNNSIKGCADDVAKEITKLKAENINGLIIDLQFNGGGSMDEVIRLAGMFIDFGPLAIIADKYITDNIINDYNRGMLYDGPVVVLVNGFSASASEFFAGVMQDYNRAVIAGSNTLGKATMQTILPLNEVDNTDFVKVTISRFYRVNGQSSQYTGIMPDIKMPALLDKLLPRESSMPTAIKNDSIPVKLNYNRIENNSMKKLEALSNMRINDDEDFKVINDINEGLEKLYETDKSPLPLTFNAVFADVHLTDAIWGTINAAAEKENNIIVRDITAPEKIYMQDDFLKSVRDYKIKSVKTDPYIKEGINILLDLYRLEQR
jgi:carboxyl-terminal processing protease